jgi:fibronectin-binding autotransporter adhesin
MGRVNGIRVAGAMQSMLLWFAFLAMILLAGPLLSARAAFTPLGDVVPADPSTWTSTTTGNIGNTSAGTLTVDGGSDLLSQYGYIGNGGTATGVVIVSGAGSTWTNSRHIYVGYSGSGTFSIAAGGAVTNSSSSYSSFIGYNSGSTGMATVSDTGSKWTSSGTLSIGYGGSGTLTVANGGSVSNTFGFLSYNTSSTGLASISGTGSTWTNNGTLSIGFRGVGTLLITNGAFVSNTYGYVGHNTGSTGTATVSGVGSTWSNTSNLYVGYNGDGTLSITNGGSVSVAGATYIGYSGTSSAGIYLGESGSGGTLTTNSLWVKAMAATGISGYGTINTAGLVGDVGLVATSSTTFTANGTAAIKLTTSAGTLGLGYINNGSLIIDNGMAISSAMGALGFLSGSSGSATVSGAGSTWTNTNLYVGYYGSGTLSITAGGSVSVANNTYVGYVGTNSGAIYLGNVGKGGTLTTGTLTVAATAGTGISGYGTINTGGLIGDVNLIATAAQTFSLNGTAVLKLTAVGDLGVGYKNNGSMTINNGAKISSANGYLGYSSGSMGSATISGSGSTWINNSYLYVGNSGSGTLSITGGGCVNATYSYISSSSNSTSTVIVSGTGSVWTSSYINIGYSGVGMLYIGKGGSVSDNTGILGYHSGSMGSVTVDGSGSTWTNGSGLYIGTSGATSGASGILTIANGGTVVVNGTTGSILGTGSLSTGIVTVDGPGSTWTSASKIYVGQYGSGTVTITNGGFVRSNTQITNPYLASMIGLLSNTSSLVTVSGTGSTWIDSIGIAVGYGGSGSLNITNGGSVSSPGAGIGYYSGSTGVAIVDGAGSKLAALSDHLYVVSVACTTYVGYAGSNSGSISFGANGGTLTTRSLCASPAQLAGTGTISARGLISDINLVFDSADDLQQTLIMNSQGQNVVVNLNMSGGSATNGELGAGWKGSGSLTVTGGITVASSSGCIGHGIGSMGTATVSGAGSTWINSGSLTIGDYGSGTFIITNGASVSSTDGHIGNYVGSTGKATVSGAGSKWTNSGLLCVGGSGSGTLSIANQGTVSNSAGRIGNYGGMIGMVAVSGTGSIWSNTDTLFVGSADNGTLSITGGGSVSDIAGYIGYNSNSKGLATVSGAGSTWSNSISLYIGYSGSGTLSITNGGIVSDTNGYVSNSNAGVVTLDGAGSKWTNSGSLTIGNNGSGTLSIANGGAVSNTYGYVGKYTQGIVTISGTTSTWTNYNSLYVGYEGSGTVTQTSGTNSVADALYLGYGSLARGTYNLNGGVLAIQTLSQGSGTATFNFGGGTLTATGTLSTSLPMTLTGTGGSATVDTPSYAVTLSGTLSGTSGLTKIGAGALTMSAANTYSGVTTISGGALHANSGAGLPTGSFLSLDGGVLQSNGTTTFSRSLGTSGLGKFQWTVNGGGFAAGAGPLTVNIGGSGGTLTWGSAVGTNIVGTLKLGSSSAANVTTFVNPIALGGLNRTVEVNDNTASAADYAVLSGVISGSGGLTKSGDGVLSLTASNIYAGPTSITAGTLKLVGTSTATPGAWNPVLNLAGADIQAGKIVFDYATNGGTSPASVIKSILTASYNTAGSSHFTSGQIFTSTAGGTSSYGLGWIDDGSAVTVKIAVYGDADLSGTVGASDLSTVLTNFGLAGVWSAGDFDYSGIVGASDLSAVLTNFGQTLPSSLDISPYRLDADAIRALGAAGITVVPEPGTLVLLAAGLIGLLAYAWRPRK